MHKHVVESILDQIKKRNIKFKDFKLLICGLAFKGDPETGDLRNSSSVEIYKMLIEKNIKAFGYDHIVKKREIENENINYYDIKKGMKRFDAILFLNNHIKNLRLDIQKLIRQMNDFPVFYDGWSQFSKDEILQIKKCTYMSLSSVKNSLDS